MNMQTTVPVDADTSGEWDLPRILRNIGALVLVASLSSFLFQGWSHVDDVTRFMMLLGQTLVLGISGVLLSKLLQEPRGARTFVGLTLIAVPVNFAIMGGLLYSQYINIFTPLAEVPDYLRWQTGDLDTALSMIGLGLATLIPMTLIGFRIMARQSARGLTLLFVALNAALLIPIRSGLYVDGMMLALTVITLVSLTKLRRKDFALATPSGRFARLMMFVPLGILFGRTLWMYGGDEFLVGFVALIVYLFTRHIGLMSKPDSWLRPFSNILGLIPAGVAAIGLVSAFCESLGISGSAQFPLTGIAMGLFMTDMSLRSVNNGAAYRSGAVFFATFAALTGLYLYGTLASVVWTIMVGTAALIFGTAIRQKSVFVMGLATTATGLIFQFGNVFTHFDFMSWGTLAATGMIAIIASSMIERHGEQMKARMSHLYDRFSGWEM